MAALDFAPGRGISPEKVLSSLKGRSQDTSCQNLVVSCFCLPMCSLCSGCLSINVALLRYWGCTSTPDLWGLHTARKPLYIYALSPGVGATAGRNYKDMLTYSRIPVREQTQIISQKWVSG